MMRVRRLHQEFSDVWNRTRTAELLKRNIDPDRGWWYRTAELLEANGLAYEAARPQSDSRDEALSILFDALPFEGFRKGEPEAIDHMLDFLEVDVPAFRCGYAKQWCYRWLKSLRIDPNQAQRLRQLTLAVCQCSGQRQELRDLARLMIKLADEPFVRALRDLAEKHKNEYTRQKAKRVLQVVLNGRPDLR